MKNKRKFSDLVNQVEQLLLGGVHAHGAHGVAQLLGRDRPAPVVVELVEGLLQLRDLLLGQLLRYLVTHLEKGCLLLFSVFLAILRSSTLCRVLDSIIDEMSQLMCHVLSSLCVFFIKYPPCGEWVMFDRCRLEKKYGLIVCRTKWWLYMKSWERVL